MELVFKQIIFKWYEKDHRENPYNEKQLCNLLYKQKIEVELIAQAIEDYIYYFETHRKYLYIPIWDKLTRDFPSWFGLADVKDQEVIKAFHDEESAIEEDNARLWIVAKINREFSDNKFGHLYEAVISLPDGISGPGQEGIPINLWWKDVEDQNNVHGVLLAYYRNTSTIIFRVSNELPKTHFEDQFRFKPKPINFLKQIKEKFIVGKLDENSLTYKLFYQKEILELDNKKIQIKDRSLNDSQRKAVESVFSQNVTFIWGPPGTGKTYTLSKIITKACSQGLRVLAVGISNISIDILGEEIIREFENYNDFSKKLLEERKLLRYGYPVLPSIVDDNRLYPQRDEVDNLRKEYSEILKAIRDASQNKNPEKKAQLINRQVLLKNSIKQTNQQRIANSKLVFTTAAQCFLGESFENEKFDLVVVDEVGMMPLIQTITIASFSNNKFVVAGDFKQLGPISVGKTEAVINWFNQDIFQFMKNVSGFENNIRVMLKEQRRMHPEICSLINDRFYGGLLTSEYVEKYSEVNSSVGSIKSSFSFIPVTPKDGAYVRLTEGKSRINVKSAEIVSELAESLIQYNSGMEIGIISPYNGQINEIKRKLNNSMLTSHELERVKIGTIHSFQGSGFDVIIWDIVDNRDKKVGLLYKGVNGERLVNVALSRAKHKLIIIGDPNVFSINDELGEVSKKLRSLMVDLRLSGNHLKLKINN